METNFFLKQVLRGKAAAALNCIPVVGDKHQTTVGILKKHFERSTNIAEILIHEIERLHGAKDHPEKRLKQSIRG
ncbi:unnamed protein product [Cylicostephanus goldi]|uniref:Uncharacterized protein n=1 Tax=Cylicostephanus goldi TaxID=71465 RepID=A0A3P6UZ93_CYLGO|nr:unnamed protein product [Cylicostephanus goldi]